MTDVALFVTAPFQIYVAECASRRLPIGRRTAFVVARAGMVETARDLLPEWNVVPLRGKNETFRTPSLRWGALLAHFALACRKPDLLLGNYSSVTMWASRVSQAKSVGFVDDGTATILVAEERRRGQFRYGGARASFYTMFESLTFGIMDSIVSVHDEAARGNRRAGRRGLVLGSPLVSLGMMKESDYIGYLRSAVGRFHSLDYLPHPSEHPSPAVDSIDGLMILDRSGSFESMLRSGYSPKAVIGFQSTALLSARAMGMRKEDVLMFDVTASQWMRRREDNEAIGRYLRPMVSLLNTS